jgi:phosphoglycolate phosphatase-like HAD superfamily hydrolase
MKLFVFDIDGTLTDSVFRHQVSYVNAYSSFNIINLDTNWNNYAHHSDSWIFGEVFRVNFDRNPTSQEKEMFSEELGRHFKDQIIKNPVSEIPGAREFLLQVFASPDIGYVFATGSLREPALLKLESLEISYAPELLITASEYETREEIVSAAIRNAGEYFGVDGFERIVSFGDGYWDFKTAEILGLEFIGIAKDEKEQKLRDAGAPVVYPDFMCSDIVLL